jgi:hypothetical protein
MYNYVSLIMCHTYTNNHKPSVVNPHINQASNPHCYAASICTNNFNNTPQPKSLKHVPRNTRYASTIYPIKCANDKQQIYQHCTSVDLSHTSMYHTTNSPSRENTQSPITISHTITNIQLQTSI